MKTEKKLLTKPVPKVDRIKVNMSALSKKHQCSVWYVNDILSGKRNRNSALAKGVYNDALAIISIYDREVNENTHRFVNEVVQQLTKKKSCNINKHPNPKEIMSEPLKETICELALTPIVEALRASQCS